MNTLTENELQLIEHAALALGYAPSRYTVRDSTVIYVSRRGSSAHYWNPLDPGRHDFFDVLTFLSSHHSLEVVAEGHGSIPGVYAAVHHDALRAPVAAVAASAQYSIPKAFCMALTRAAQKFHKEVTPR
jgi:hypothetical protein